MKAFYNKLIAEFEKAETIDKFNAVNVPAVGYIDLYAAQEQDEENFELFARPTVLVEWDINHSTDPATATITVYACYEQLRDTSNISANREAGLRFLDYVRVVDEVISNIESEDTGKPEIKTEGFNKMDSIVDIYILTYECSYKRKNPRDKYQEGSYDSVDISGCLNYQFD